MLPLEAPVLTDGVVTLRALRPSDVPAVVEQCNDPVSIRWTTVPVPYGEEQARAWISEIVPAGWSAGTDLCFAIEYDGRFAGSASLRPDRDGNAEIAYGLTASARGHGVAGRAARLLLGWGFEECGFHLVHWRANVGNWGSRRVAWAVGFQFGPTIPELLNQRGVRVDAWTGWIGAQDERKPRTPWLQSPVLDTPRIRLRPWRENEVGRIAGARTNDATAHFLPFIHQPFDEERARWLLEHVEEQASTGSRFNWCVADRDTDLGLGNVTLFGLGDPNFHDPELGYWAHPDAWGRGVMSHALRRICEWYFTPVDDGGFGGQRVRIRTASSNKAARGVAEAAGFQLVGIERAAFPLGDGTVDDRAVYDRLATDPA